MDITLILELALFVLLIGLSAFFSSSETSLFSLGNFEIERMRRDDNPRVDLVERLLSEPRRLIVTILIGNEFVNVAASVLSAAILVRVLGADNILANLLVMVPILLLLGEITPKTLAIRNNIAFATFQSPFLQGFAILIKPLRWVVRLFADWLTTLIVGSERSPGSIVTEDMVRVLAHEAVGEGVLDSNEAGYVDRVFDFGHSTVGELRTPRSHITYLSAQMPISEVVEVVRRTRHTKFPVFEGKRDNVIGFLYARDLVGFDLGAMAGEPDSLRAILREPYLVAENKPASELFHSFRQQRLSLALTIDEYGGTTGLVTMESLLERIFGDIPSHSENADVPDHSMLENGRIRMPGGMPITRFNRLTGSKLGDGESRTVGGLLLRHYGELPEPGAITKIGEYAFLVESLEDNRIAWLVAEHAADGSAGEMQTRPPAGDPENDS